MVNKQYASLTVRQCHVNGEAHPNFEFAARLHLASSDEQVREALRRAAPHAYLNDRGENVEWRVVDVLAVDEVSGEPDVAGVNLTSCIVSAEEVAGWAQRHRSDGE